MYMFGCIQMYICPTYLPPTYVFTDMCVCVCTTHGLFIVVCVLYADLHACVCIPHMRIYMYVCVYVGRYYFGSLLVLVPCFVSSKAHSAY